MSKIKTVSGWNYFSLALGAFAALGLEVILGLLIEPIMYGVPMKQWSTTQNILHWIMTCIAWAISSVCIIRLSKKTYNFDVFHKAPPMKTWQWAAIIGCVIFMLVESYISWNGFKVIKEYNYNGLVKFIFQYIYYFFETILIVLIVAFGQKSCEKWFKNEKIPYGGIVVTLTWELSHILTNGNISFTGIVYGIVYLLVNKDMKKTFLLSYIMFVF